MVSSCMVLWCPNKGKIKGVSYFSLTGARYNTWMRALGRNPTVETLSGRNVVCSDHFLECHKIATRDKVRLTKNAIPKLKLKQQIEVPPARTKASLAPLENAIYIKEEPSCTPTDEIINQSRAALIPWEYPIDVKEEPLCHYSSEEYKEDISVSCASTVEIITQSSSSSQSTYKSHLSPKKEYCN